MVKKEVIKILSETAAKNTEEISIHLSIRSLDLDSLDILELIMNLEDKFDILIPTNAMSKINTVGDMIKYIERKVSI